MEGLAQIVVLVVGQVFWGALGASWHSLLRRSPRVEAAVLEALSKGGLTADELVDACREHNEQYVLDVIDELREAGRLDPRPGRRGRTLLHLNGPPAALDGRPQTF